MFGDTAIAFDGGSIVRNLDLSSFHTYRFRSRDGQAFDIAVDGVVFMTRPGVTQIASAQIQMGGAGGCAGQQPTVNEWDFVRYGTISYGEKIVAADPPAGFADAGCQPPFDRFTVRFNEANYVYVDEIGVGVFDAEGNVQETSSIMPVVKATRRLDNGPPEVVEIVLDKPIPQAGRTVFTFNDGAIVQTVAYTYVKGDANADGRFDLADWAELQNCFGDRLESRSHIECSPAESCRCRAFDFNDNFDIGLDHHAVMAGILNGPG